MMIRGVMISGVELVQNEQGEVLYQVPVVLSLKSLTYAQLLTLSRHGEVLLDVKNANDAVEEA